MLVTRMWMLCMRVYILITVTAVLVRACCVVSAHHAESGWWNVAVQCRRVPTIKITVW